MSGVALSEVDAMARQVARRVSKAQSMVARLSRPMSNEARNKLLHALKSNLQQMDADVCPGWLNDYRVAYRERHPRVKPGKTHPPADMRCKKCEREFEDPFEFFFDDGHGVYGYTGRCRECRGHGKAAA